MRLLNESGRLNKMAVLTYFILALFPIIFGFVQNINFFILTDFMDWSIMANFVIVELWGLSFAVFLAEFVRRRAIWKKEQDDD